MSGTKKPTLFVAISGPQGAGKTHLATDLARRLNQRDDVDVFVGSIAYPIKRIAAVLTDDRAFIASPAACAEAKQRFYSIPESAATPLRTMITGRKLLQDIGRAFRSAYNNPGFWHDLLLQQYTGKYDIVLIDDCRLPYEAQAGISLRIYLDSTDHPIQENPSDETERDQELLKENADIEVCRDADSYSIDLSRWKERVGPNVELPASSGARLLASIIYLVWRACVLSRSESRSEFVETFPNINPDGKVLCTQDELRASMGFHQQPEPNERQERP